MRGLMNSRAAISGFESPSRASWEIWRSWAVSSSRVSGRALADGLAGGQELAPGALGERLDAHAGEHVVGRAQLLARVDAAALAAQPFAVEQMAAGELDAQAGPAEPRDRLTVEIVGDIAVAEQGADPGVDPQHPVGRRHTRAFGQPPERGPDERHVAGPRRRLGQLGHEPRRGANGSRSKTRQAASRAAACRPRPLLSTAVA